MMFFKKLFEWLNIDLTGRSWYSEARHKFFGDMVYCGFKNNNSGYWECELDFARSSVTVIINSPNENLPTSKHEQFIRSIIGDLDATFRRIEPLVMKTLSGCDWLNVSENVQWQQLFKLSGIEVPIEANELNDWEISFECLADKERHIFTYCFKNGVPSFISVEG